MLSQQLKNRLGVQWGISESKVNLPSQITFKKVKIYSAKKFTCPGTSFQSTNQNLGIAFQEISVFRLTIRIRCFYTLVNQLSFPSDFRNKLWVRFRGRDWVKSVFLDSNVDPG